jgi:hypothetical protein
LAHVKSPGQSGTWLGLFITATAMRAAIFERDLPFAT